MDPDAALALIRTGVALFNSRQDRGDEAAAADAAVEIMEAIEGLDNWITNGGFLPRAWTKETT